MKERPASSVLRSFGELWIEDENSTSLLRHLSMLAPWTLLVATNPTEDIAVSMKLPSSAHEGIARLLEPGPMPSDAQQLELLTHTRNLWRSLPTSSKHLFVKILD